MKRLSDDATQLENARRSKASITPHEFGAARIGPHGSSWANNRADDVCLAESYAVIDALMNVHAFFHARRCGTDIAITAVHAYMNGDKSSFLEDVNDIAFWLKHHLERDLPEPLSREADKCRLLLDNERKHESAQARAGPADEGRQHRERDDHARRR